MIDLHCHLLPGVDDGAPDLASGLALARAAVDNGIRLAVLTPHVFPGRWDNTRSRLKPHFTVFRRLVAEAGIPLQLRLGAEIRVTPELPALLDAGELPSLGALGGRPVLLFELPDGEVPADAMRTVEFLLGRDVVPMIAHPERNKDVMRDPARMRPFVEAGCLLQLTAASICGWFGRPAQHGAWAILDAGWADVVATDAHNLAHRPPVLAEARHALRLRYGRDVAERLTRGRPAEIVRHPARPAG